MNTEDSAASIPVGRLLSCSVLNRGVKRLEEEIGLWSIIQTPSASVGTFLIGAGPNTVLRPYFGDMPEAWVRRHSRMLYVKAHAGHLYKIGINPKSATGLLGFLRISRTDSSLYTLLVNLNVAKNL